jgi:predicted enzyme related to lactoylglutathione lyase/broad specificity phosphatase PhoE
MGWQHSKLLGLGLTAILLSLTACAASGDIQGANNKADAVTTVYLIRHAEKQRDGSADPVLTEQGQFRANKWAELFKEADLAAIYSTDTRRTRATAEPTASSKRKEILLYDSSNVDYQAFIAQHRGQSVLVVGHSNTTPAFSNGLLGELKYQDLADHNNAALVTVVVNGESRSSSVLTINPKSSSLTKTAKGSKSIMLEHEKINYLEFQARDIEATKAFFIQAFAWEFTDYGPDYTSFSGQGVDGGFEKSELFSSSEQGSALTIFYSEQLEQTQTKVEAAGGKIIKAIFPFPGGRRFHFSEPSGNEFAVWSDS